MNYDIPAHETSMGPFCVVFGDRRPGLAPTCFGDDFPFLVFFLGFLFFLGAVLGVLNA